MLCGTARALRSGRSLLRTEPRVGVRVLRSNIRERRGQVLRCHIGAKATTYAAASHEWVESTARARPRVARAPRIARDQANRERKQRSANLLAPCRPRAGSYGASSAGVRSSVGAAGLGGRFLLVHVLEALGNHSGSGAVVGA